MTRPGNIFAKTLAAPLSLIAGAAMEAIGAEPDSHSRHTTAAAPAGVRQDSQSQALTEESGAPSDDDEKDIADLTIEELMDVVVVVTPSRREQKMRSVPYALSVITADDIRAAGARSVPDALRLAPGVDVAELSYGQAAVAPRGFHGFLARQVLVLVDGRQIFDSHFGGTLWGSWPFQLEDIERFEIIRGPGGVTWGANAVNGVINIITKDPADQLGTTMTLGGGSRGAHKAYLGHAFKEEDFRFRLSGEYEGSDGFREGGTFLGPLEDDYKIGRFNLHGIGELGPDETLTFSLGSAVLDGGFPRTPLGGIGWNKNPGSQASFVMANWSRQVAEGNRLELTGYVNDFYVSPGVKQIDYRYQQIALQFSQTFTSNANHVLTWGIDTRSDLLDATNSDPQMLSRGSVNTFTGGLYVQDEWRLAPKWTLDLGARIDYESYGGFEPSARASLAHELTDDSLLYGSISRAFQMPPAGLRFLEMPVLNGLVWATGDKDVDAETLVAYELGYRARWFDRLETSLNVFWNEFDDTTTLSPRIGPPGLLTLDFDNRASASMYGLEFDARYTVSQKLTFLANYTFQELDWRSSVPFHDKDLISAPKHKAMVGVRYSPASDLHLSSHVYYVDATEAPRVEFPFAARRIDPYLRVDLQAEYEFWDDDASLAVGVRNLFDDGHPEGGTLFLDYAEVPRTVFAEFRLRIR